ncbi:MAG: hypothetical protein QOJ84_2520 [Bradyrhizobium sp.]|jgi:hypothetical protein|nr:hypothetical protein [Bradyrhizobium sp.]
MKTIAVIAASTFLSVTVLSSFSPVAYAAAPGAMSGKSDYATRGYRQAAKQKAAKSGAKMRAPMPQKQSQ